MTSSFLEKLALFCTKEDKGYSDPLSSIPTIYIGIENLLDLAFDSWIQKI
jgi:hypothetical protein